jgi:hypothetical protein
MKAREFKTLMRELLGPVLEPAGFTAQGSKHSVFWRKASQDVYHLVIPAQSRWNAVYYLHICATSPEVEPNFAADFPDRGAIITSRAYRLGRPVYWIGGWQSAMAGTGGLFRCDDEATLRADFEKRAKPLLVRYGLAYLNHLKTISDFIPWIEHPLTLAFAYNAIGKKRRAASLIRKNLHLLRPPADESDPRYAATLERAARIVPELRTLLGHPASAENSA